MWRVTVKGLLARKLRLALTAVSIVLGVTFITGTLVITDTLNSTLSSLFGSVYQRVDFQVQAPGVLNIPESVLGRVRAVPGVADAAGEVSGYARFVAHDGKPISTGIEPAEGLAWVPAPALSAFQLVAGRAPTNPHDVVMDQATAQRYHFAVGDPVRVLLPSGEETFRISGIASFVGAGDVPGATFASFSLPTAQKLFGAVGQLYTIDVLTRPGVNKQRVRQDIARLLPTGIQVVSGRTVAEQQASSTAQSVAPLTTVLLVFGLIALVVGAFTIFNTFSIIVGQRTRELALLRVVGAGRGQLLGSVLLEALLVATVASLVGLGLGVLVALGLEALLNALGVPLPSGPLVFEPATAAAGLGVGVIATLVAAVGPAWRAVRIPAVAALSAQTEEPESGSKRRILPGGFLAVLGLGILGLGLGRPSLAMVGVGALGIFVGGAMLAPAAARPFSRAIGVPLGRLLGSSGHLGQVNAMRSPRRTAHSASALFVGLALVSAVSVIGASLAQAATSSVDNAIRADLIVSSSSGTLGAGVARGVSALPHVSSSCLGYGADFEVRGSTVALKGICTSNLAANVILRVVAGTAVPALSRGELLVDATTARTQHLRVGTLVAVSFPEAAHETIRVGGIFQPNALIGGYLVGDQFFQAHFPGQLPGAVLVSADRGYAGIVDEEVTRAVASNPNLTVQTRGQFEAAQTAAVDQALGLVYVLLALAVIIAFIGVANTLLLSVFERVRELGLLRAVGMQRRQVRVMVRAEAVIVALFGDIAGVVVGTGLGAAFTVALSRQQAATAVVVPYESLVVFLVIAILLGLAAASWPARRAARLDVLGAIGVE